MGHHADMAIVVMGVSASGKSAVGRAVADALGVAFVDGDDLHPAANVAKMSAGEPLTDADRSPWLDAVGAVLAEDAGAVVVACSALKAAYRDRIRHRADRPVHFLHLDVSRDELERRIMARTDHFMPPSLLDDQLATLEWPGDEADVTILDADRPAKAVIADAVAAVSQPPRSGPFGS